jgi:hypothetical protein
MSIQKKLNLVFKIIVDEMYENKEFSKKIEQAIDGLVNAPSTIKDTKPANKRRKPAVLDPISKIREHGELELKMDLSKLDLEQLKDIVSEYGMDAQKLVMKWKQPQKIIDKIIEVSLSRADKGKAFLAESNEMNKIESSEMNKIETNDGSKPLQESKD